MAEYLLEVAHYMFIGPLRFQADGENEAEALENGRKYVKALGDKWYIPDSLKVARKKKETKAVSDE